MNIGDKVFTRLFSDKTQNKDYFRLKETFKMACLLHDIGHAPLSHSTESVMPRLCDLNIPSHFLFKTSDLKRQASHEDYTVKAIADSSFSESFKLLNSQYGVDTKHIASLIVGYSLDDGYFTIDGINYFNLLHQLVSSELDCDRMDYLLRDSYFCGVSYGNFDLDWLIDNLEVAVIDKKATLGITERAVVTFDDFLLSRYHMFIMVYFHYRAVCLEQLLLKYFKSSNNEYSIPADIEQYIEHDDYHLMKVLRNSDNKYAQSIVQNRIPEKIFESFNDEQLTHLEEVQQYLDQNNLDYIRGSSASRLSKYYDKREENNKNSLTMKVVRKSPDGKSMSYSNIENVTKVFEKFSKSHSINRLHCNLNELDTAHQQEIQKLLSKA
jgi:HD superfamily phosphohydrolase